MQIRPNKKNKSDTTTNVHANKQHSTKQTIKSLDNSKEHLEQKKMQSIVDNSSEAVQMQQWQEKLNHSPEIVQMEAWQKKVEQEQNIEEEIDNEQVVQRFYVENESLEKGYEWIEDDKWNAEDYELIPWSESIWKGYVLHNLYRRKKKEVSEKEKKPKIEKVGELGYPRKVGQH